LNTELPIDPALQEQMANTQQNPRYHAEGSVLAHTQMVVRKYLELRDLFELTEEEKQVLYWASVLHDIGKTQVTRFENGRWTSPGHEKAGLPMALDHLLRKSDLNLAARRKVLDLVRWHGMPLRWIRYGRNMDDLKVLGTRTDLRLLSIFTVFDFHGRICEYQDNVLESIEHFRQVQVPQAEYELAPYAELHRRYLGWNHRHQDAAWKAVKMKDMTLLEKLVTAAEREAEPTRGKRVLLTVGPPLSGKTTWLETTHPELFRISMAEHGMAEADLGDGYYEARKLIEFKHFLTVYLNRYKQVALDGTNLNESFRHRLAEMIRDMHVDLEYQIFHAPLPLLLERNRRREAPEDEGAITNLYLNMELVHPWEAHGVGYQ
jgi:putative nucleotidyltransferase with HDIG domain